MIDCCVLRTEASICSSFLTPFASARSSISSWISMSSSANSGIFSLDLVERVLSHFVADMEAWLNLDVSSGSLFTYIDVTFKIGWINVAKGKHGIPDR